MSTCAGAHGGQKRALDLQEQELQAAVSSLTWVLRTELWSSGRETILLLTEESSLQPNNHFLVPTPTNTSVMVTCISGQHFITKGDFVKYSCNCLHFFKFVNGTRKLKFYL